jgi:hypothetical protein
MRAKRFRDTLSEAEEVELVLGVEPGYSSLFATAAARAEARALFSRIQEARDPMGELIARGSILREARRRHADHPHDVDDLDCARCNPNGWRPPRDEEGERRRAAAYEAMLERDAILMGRDRRLDA